MDLFVISQTTADGHHSWMDAVWSRTGLNGIISTTLDRSLYNAHSILLGMCLRNETVQTVPLRLHGDLSEWSPVSTVPDQVALPSFSTPDEPGELLEYIDCSGFKHVGRLTALTHPNIGNAVLPVFKRHITEQATVAGLVAFYRVASQAVIDQYTLEVGESLATKVAGEEAHRLSLPDGPVSGGTLSVDADSKTITISVPNSDEEGISHDVAFLLRDYILQGVIDVPHDVIIDGHSTDAFSEVLLKSGYTLIVNIV